MVPASAATAVFDALQDRDGLVPVSLVLDHVRPAYGGASWPEALAYLHGEPAEADVIAALVATGAAVFDSPIRVFRADPDDRPEDDTHDFAPNAEGSVWAIGNGMHRVAAAVAMGHPSIRCTAADAPDEEQAVETYVDAEFKFPHVTGWGPGEFEAVDCALDFVCGWLRSFPLPDGTWVEGEAFASRGRVFSGLWSCPPTHSETLVRELQSRFARFAPRPDGALEFTSVRVCTGADL